MRVMRLSRLMPMPLSKPAASPTRLRADRVDFGQERVRREDVERHER